VSKDAPPHLQRRALAANLLKPAQHEKTSPQPGSKNYPAVPGKDDLVGFVTSGNFNLGEGKGTGVANLFVRKVLGEDVEKYVEKERFLCIVREAGQGLGRLAKWEVV
jgi:ribonuclease P/MRP protein subunit POP1